MNARRVLGSAGVAAVAIGAGLAGWGSTLPIFSDKGAASDLYMRWCSETGRPDPAIGARYDALFTARYSLLDGGVALALAGLTLAGLAWVARGGGQSVRTPVHRWTFLAIGLGCVAFLLAGSVVGLVDDFNRMRFPTCADSIGIPLFGMVVLGPILAAALMVAGWLVSRLFSNLPVSLIAWDRDRATRSWLLLAIWGALAVLVLLATLSVGLSADRWAVPGGVVALYLIASTRAALTAPGRPA